MEETIVSPETNEEVVTSQEEQPVEEATEEDSKTPTLEDYYALEKKNKELFERAKKAELANKELKVKSVIDKPNQGDATFKDKLILIAQGKRPEVVEEAEIIAKAKGIPLKEALEYPTIKSFEEAIIAKEKSEKAQLSASGSGGSSKMIDPYNIVGESEEDHKKRFEEELKKRGLK